jgi:large subunit ribosomal protein L10
MPKSKQEKKEIIKVLRDKLENSKSVVFVHFDKLPVKLNESLRKKLKDEGGEYYVAKKTLMDVAFQDAKIDSLSPRDLEGRVAAVFGYSDEVAPAKVLKDFQKENEEISLEFKGGILEGKFIQPTEVAALAEVPGRQELYARLVGSLNAPVSGFVNVLAGNLRSLLYALKAIEETKN